MPPGTPSGGLPSGRGGRHAALGGRVRRGSVGVSRAARDLFPGYFAIVMATGIVAIACHRLSLPWTAMPLMVIGWLCYLTLWALTIIRFVRYPRRFAHDLSSHQRAPGFFTIVAGTCVLGSQETVVMRWSMMGEVLWYFGLFLWVVVMYAFFTAVMVRRRKATLATGINGAWLIAAVATQSIVVLRAGLDPAGAPAPWMGVVCIGFFMIGSMLYLAIIPLIFYRLTFLPLAPKDFTAPYWINMGAAAISALAGGLLVGRADLWPLLGEFKPFIKGMAVFFWAVGTWWIPILVSLMVWRYVVRRDPLRYEPSLWAMVFPLGMYTVATLQIASAIPLPAIRPIADVFLFPALIAWTATFCGLLVTLCRAARG